MIRRLQFWSHLQDVILAQTVFLARRLAAVVRLALSIHTQYILLLVVQLATDVHRRIENKGNIDNDQFSPYENLQNVEMKFTDG